MASPSTTQHLVSPHALAKWLPINKTHAGPGNRTTNTHTIGTPANYSDILSVDTRLAAINGTLYTQARLNTMTLNDKLYALARNDDQEFAGQ